jgi:hypothetical protein
MYLYNQYNELKVLLSFHKIGGFNSGINEGSSNVKELYWWTMGGIGK